MDFSFSEEQDELRGVLRAFLSEPCEPSLIWRRLVHELELVALPIPEDRGGAGASFVEVGIALEETGAALLPVPLLSTVVAASVLVFGNEAATTPYLQRVLEGASVAVAPPSTQVNGTPERLPTARNGANGLILDGVLAQVFDVSDAQLLLVAAEDESGPLFAVIEVGSRGVVSDRLPALDQTRSQSRVLLTNAPAIRISKTPGRVAVDHALDVVRTAFALESIGGARRCLDLAVAHLNTRTQFGRPLSSFQALRHRCADLAVELEAARSAAYYAAWAVNGAPEELQFVAPVAKAVCCDCFLHAAAECIQLHGGIGFTWEHEAHLYFKRAKTNEMSYGSSRQLRDLAATRAGVI
jgi:alkylation response protein AidB-like acyl-CoA dehydrogenase